MPEVNTSTVNYSNPRGLPHLLYTEPFLDNRDAQTTFNRVNLSDDQVREEYNSLIQKANEPLNDSSKTVSALIELQKFTFNANWESRLQPFGYYNVDQNLGLDLYKKLKTPQAYSIETVSTKSGEGNVVIQPLNPEDSSIDLSEITNGPLVYISSPYGIAKAESNIADLDPFWGGYMIAYWEGGANNPRYVISGGQQDREGKISTEIFNPISFTNYNTVDVKLGNSSDIILYDNSHQKIVLNDGNDTALAALMAYQPSLLFGQNIIDAQAGNEKLIIYRTGELPYRGTAGRPFAAGVEQGTINFQTNSSSPNEEVTTQLFINRYSADFESRPYPYNYADLITIADADKIKTHSIIVGGQTIQGNKGNDTLYGLDPSLYSEFQADELASSSNATGKLDFNIFNDPKTDIDWKPITLSGGIDQDTFILGDLGRINPQKTQTPAAYYTILGDKDDISETNANARSKKSWGDTMAADEVQLTAHYDFTEEVIQDAINIDLVDPTASASDIYQATTTVIGNFNAVAEAIGAAKFLPFPAINGILGGIGLIGSITNATSKDRSSRQELYREEIKQKVVPPGKWNQAIKFADWDPMDRITIQTMPIADPDVKQANQWQNISFTIKEENNQAAGGYGLTIQQQTSVGGTAPLAYLNGLKPGNGSEYGFQTFNFFTGSNQIINPLQDMTFLGVLSDVTDEDIKINYTETAYLNSIEISKDNPIFLWNSKDLSADKLNQYRSSASSIQIGIDSRKFGWYTEIKVKADNPSEPDLDNSTLNYWDKSSKSWASVSFQAFESMRKTDDLYKLAQKAKFEYWTAQDTHGDQLMNLAASDADNFNDIDFYKSRDDGSVKDPVTGRFLKPSDDGYQQAALSEENYAGAFSIKQSNENSIQYIIEDGYKLSPFISTTFEDGKVDHIFAYDEVHAGEAGHTRDSMVQIEDSGIIRFEDVIGGDYDYNDAVLDPSLNPQLASHLASALYSNG